jgi:E3 ubiquitin-protein ligase RGLG
MDPLALLFALIVGFVLWTMISPREQDRVAAERGGASNAGAGRRASAPSLPFARIRDKYETIEQVQEALRQAGLESSQLMIGIDATKSNTWTGATSFGGRCLHDVGGSTGQLNPYESVIQIIGSTLAAFDDDGLIPVYYFGDAVTTDRSVAVLRRYPDEPEMCHGLPEVLARYRAVLPTLKLAGPTSFTPIIRKAIEYVKRERCYTILLIIADGQVSDPAETMAAIEDASSHPISIVVVGVGDGPWDTMNQFDDFEGKRKFDNLQFVRASSFLGVRDATDRDAAFAVACLQEIPEQYSAIHRLRLLG